MVSNSDSDVNIKKVENLLEKVSEGFRQATKWLKCDSYYQFRPFSSFPASEQEPSQGNMQLLEHSEKTDTHPKRLVLTNASRRPVVDDSVCRQFANCWRAASKQVIYYVN